MPRCFVKQPDGKYAIWSTIVDSFVTVDCTPGEAIDEELHDPFYGRYPGGPDALLYDLCREFENIRQTGRAWKWSPTWDEAIARIRELHGEGAVAEVMGLLDSKPTGEAE